MKADQRLDVAAGTLNPQEDKRGKTLKATGEENSQPGQGRPVAQRMPGQHEAVSWIPGTKPTSKKTTD